MPEDLSGWINGIGTVYGFVGQNPGAVTLSVVGLLLLLLTAALAFKAIKSKPEDFSLSWMIVLYISLVGGIVFSAAAPSVSLLQIARLGSGPVVTQSNALENLRTNQRVYWLIRLIPYDPVNEQELSIGKLSKLGRDDQDYVFVADYNELRGYTVSTAVRMTGGSFQTGQRVSAIIFPLTQVLYPADARGVLKVVRLVESEEGPHVSVPFNVDAVLRGLTSGELEVQDLGRDQIPTYSWESIKGFFHDECEVAMKFRCEGNYTARNFIGQLSADWHPLGFSRKEIDTNEPCANREQMCTAGNWDAVTKPVAKAFGARAFFVHNRDIATISGRIMIAFEDPDGEIIPDIGHRPPPPEGR